MRQRRGDAKAAGVAITPVRRGVASKACAVANRAAQVVERRHIRDDASADIRAIGGVYVDQLATSRSFCPCWLLRLSVLSLLRVLTHTASI